VTNVTLFSFKESMKNLIIIFMALFLILGCETKPKQENATTNKKAQESKLNPVNIKDQAKVVSKENKPVIKKPIVKKKIKELLDEIEFTEGIYLNAFKSTGEKFLTILDTAQAAGINTIIFDLKNMKGDTFFEMPQKSIFRDERRKMSLDIHRIVNAAHERDMKAVARMVMFHDRLLADSLHSFRPQMADGTAWQESKKGDGAWLDSSNRDVQKDLLQLIEHAAQSGVDEIQMDYVRFPTQGIQADASFAFEREDALRSKIDSTYVSRERQDIIAAFVKEAKKVCDKHGVTLAADVFAVVAWQRNADIRSTGQNIPRMTKHLDSIHPMIYSSHFNKDFGYREDTWNEPYYITYKGTKLARDFSNKKCKVIPYIQSNTWRVKYTEDYVIGQIQSVKDAGGDGYILWNSGSNYFTTLGWIKKYNRKG